MMTKQEIPVDSSGNALPLPATSVLTMVLVLSQNWMITSGDDVKPVRNWASREDRAYFSYIRRLSSLNIMGNKTFEEIASFIPETGGREFIVMTKSPGVMREKYTNLQRVHFTSESPEEISKKIALHVQSNPSGVALHLGGAESALAFLNSSSPPQEVLLTIEPIMFEHGILFPAESIINEKYESIGEYVLNDSGTLLRHLRLRTDNHRSTAK